MRQEQAQRHFLLHLDSLIKQKPQMFYRKTTSPLFCCEKQACLRL